MSGGPREVPVLVVLPPRTLLLDVAGPVEVLRKANEVQEGVRYTVSYAGPSERLATSIGLPLSGIAPLPAAVPDDGIVVVAGSAGRVMGAAQDDPADAVSDAAAEERIVEWLRAVVGRERSLVCVCSGSLLAGRAGLLDGRACTTHHACLGDLSALAPAATVLENPSTSRTAPASPAPASPPAST